MSREDHDYLFKLILIGEAGSGKSCLLHYFVEGKFRKNSSYTIGVEFGSKTVALSGKQVKCQIWDTAGQERYRAVTRSYYRGAVGAVIVYDVSRRESYERIANWVQDARTLARADTTIMLIGNKSDLKDKREVSFLEASKFAQEQDLLFLETSALSGEGVEEAFMRLAKTVLSKVQDGSVDLKAASGSLTAGVAPTGGVEASSSTTACSC